jgi:hypothetical protein
MGTLPPPDAVIDPPTERLTPPTAVEIVSSSNAAPLTIPVPSVESKPAAGVFVGACTVLGLSIVNRYTDYQPTIEEATSITVIVSGLAMWLIPPTVRRKLNGEDV